MANNKIHLLENPPDATGGRYVVFRNSAGQAWNGSAYAAYTSTRDTWDVQATHLAAGLWEVTIPATLPIGFVSWEWYSEATPGVRSDANDQRRAVGSDDWDGTDLVSTVPLSKSARDRFNRSAKAIVTGTVGALATATTIPTSVLDPAASGTDQFKGRVLIFDAGTLTPALRGQGARITANTPTGILTVTTLTTPPNSLGGDTFTIT